MDRVTLRFKASNVRRAALALLLPVTLSAQTPVTRHAGNDSVKAVPGRHYQAGGLKRFFLGPTYRDLWTTEVTVPVLDLRRFAGGLTPTKAGGGNQTRSVRFLGPDGSDWVFRLVDKDNVSVGDGWRGTIVESIARDQVSSHHPAGALVAAPLLEAAGVLHATPILAVMPDDSLLGELREEFAGRLGSIEPYPNKPDDAPGFAGAIQIIESQDLRALSDSAPVVRIDTRGYLAARLMDVFLHDWDRHPGNWKWARLDSKAAATWQPIPRDRDKTFMQYGGIVSVASRFSPNLQRFDDSYRDIRGYLWNSRDMDRRLLIGMERPVWDSTAKALQRRLSDRVIDQAVLMMPREYYPVAGQLAATLKQRRDRLPELAERIYLHLAADPDIHGTDRADHATVVRHEDGSVEVTIRTRDEPWLNRRFHPHETDEVRLYLHGGDDRAVVTGAVGRSMPVRIIGGDGTNRLVDSSRVAGRPNQARLYDHGKVSGVEYSKPDTLFDRRPWVRWEGKLIEPGRDRGGALAPLIGFNIPGDVGVVLHAGVRQTRYGFRVLPYAARSQFTAEYATGITAWRLTGSFDRRREGGPVHLLGQAQMSELEVINFFGLGNDTPETPDLSFRVEQRQWLLEPAVGFSLGGRSDLRVGPVLKYSTTDSVADNFLSTSRPYGFGEFGQAGLRVSLLHDRRRQDEEKRNGILLELGGDWYPGLWDVEESFATLGGSAAAYYTTPLPLHPVLVLRANARKLFGDFPFHESAFIGGRGSVRVLDPQRYAGDASLGGSTELQIPFPTMPLILPVATGIYGFADAGRVYLDGESPGGWHSGVGVGFWIGVLRSSTALSIELGRYQGDTRVRVRSGLNF